MQQAAHPQMLGQSLLLQTAWGCGGAARWQRGWRAQTLSLATSLGEAKCRMRRFLTHPTLLWRVSAFWQTP